MTLDELRFEFPTNCRVQMRQTAINQGYHLTFKGTSGLVEGYTTKQDLAGQEIPLLVLWLHGMKRRRDCQPSLWERVAGEVKE